MAEAADISSIFKNEEKCIKCLTEVKSFKNPPQGIIDTMAAVAILLGKDPSWESAKKLMANPKAFLNMLRTFDKDNIKPEAITKVREYTSKSDFTQECMMKRSLACGLLCKWVIAVERNHTNK